MGSVSLQVVTLVITNPEWHPDGVHSDPKTLKEDHSFTFNETDDIRTLSNGNSNSENDITGLLYVPDLDPGDPCFTESAPFVPSNVTRPANLPRDSNGLVAIAPWTSPGCASYYLQAATTNPTRAFVFYMPDNSTTPPPDGKASAWNIGSGDSWKKDTKFPVYAIPGAKGQIIVHQSSLYSGNMTDVPYGHILTETLDSRDYVRLCTRLNLGGTSTSLPSLWVFLLVVLGILLTIIGLTSLSMHWIQRRRRLALRRRVASGEVDLEALGIKRLTVPQELLDEMPLYTYGTGQPVSPDLEAEDSLTQEKMHGATSKTSTMSRPAPALIRGNSYRPSPLSQPTCPICLDDFVSAEAGTEGTTVRELPCHHIFHPECVDIFLRDSSSLCPMCKKTALPRGYCPRVITNAMVRRERMVRQIRERIDADGMETGRLGSRITSGLRSRTMSGFSQLRTGRRMSSLRPHEDQPMQQLGPTPRQAPGTADTTSPLAPGSELSSDPSPSQPQVQPPSTSGRREWARQRAVAMLGPRAPVDPDAEEARQTPAWRKAIRGLFPRR